MRRIGLLFVVGIEIALVSSPLTFGSTRHSGLHGVVRRGPTTPVCVAERPCSKPAAGVKLVFIRAGTAVARVTTKQNGSYRVRLAPGMYQVTTSTVRPARPLKPSSVTVRASLRRVNFFLDSGIR